MQVWRYSVVERSNGSLVIFASFFLLLNIKVFLLPKCFAAKFFFVTKCFFATKRFFAAKSSRIAL